MMTKLISIKDAPKYVDQEVKMHVWLTDKRSSGKIMWYSIFSSSIVKEKCFRRII